MANGTDTSKELQIQESRQLAQPEEVV